MIYIFIGLSLKVICIISILPMNYDLDNLNVILKGLSVCNRMGSSSSFLDWKITNEKLLPGLFDVHSNIYREVKNTGEIMIK